MEILGAGFARTGTMSTRHALVKLGLDPCFHMENVISENYLDEFIDAFNGNLQPLIGVLKRGNFKATLDFPIIALVDELLPHFPEAKVLLNVRDTSDAWVTSFRNTVWKAMETPAYVRINQLLPRPFSVVAKSKFQFDLSDATLQCIIDKGNKEWLCVL